MHCNAITLGSSSPVLLGPTSLPGSGCSSTSFIRMVLLTDTRLVGSFGVFVNEQVLTSPTLSPRLSNLAQFRLFFSWRFLAPGLCTRWMFRMLFFMVTLRNRFLSAADWIC